MGVFNILVLGLTWTQGAIVLGGAHLVGRFLFAVGYRKSVKGRMLGVAISFLTLFLMFAINVYRLFSFASAISAL